MIRTLLLFSVLCILLLSSIGSAELMEPNKDILTINSDGELIKVFGPNSFYFNGSGFENPVSLVNGTLKIGGS